MSKPEREADWPLFKESGISRKEFESMEDNEYNMILTALRASIDPVKPDFNVAQDNYQIQPQQEEEYITLEQEAKKIAKKCKNPFPLDDLLRLGARISDEFIQEFEGQHVSLDSIRAPKDPIIPSQRNPNFNMHGDIDSQGVF